MRIVLLDIIEWPFQQFNSFQQCFERRYRGDCCFRRASSGEVGGCISNGNFIASRYCYVGHKIIFMNWRRLHKMLRLLSNSDCNQFLRQLSPTLCSIRLIINAVDEKNFSNSTRSVGLLGVGVTVINALRRESKHML